MTSLRDSLSPLESIHRVIIEGAGFGQTQAITDILRGYPAETKIVIVEDHEDIQIPMKFRDAIRIPPSGKSADNNPIPAKAFGDMLIAIKPDVIAFRHTNSFTTQIMVKIATRTLATVFAIADDPDDLSIALQRLVKAGFTTIKADAKNAGKITLPGIPKPTD